MVTSASKMYLSSKLLVFSSPDSVDKCSCPQWSLCCNRHTVARSAGNHQRCCLYAVTYPEQPGTCWQRQWWPGTLPDGSSISRSGETNWPGTITRVITTKNRYSQLNELMQTQHRKSLEVKAPFL